MFLTTLPNETLTALQKLDRSHFGQKANAYLAGGTALSIHLGHRLSVDLDFFTDTQPNTEIVIQNLTSVGHLQVEKREEGTLLCNFENIKLSLLYFPYPNLSPATKILTNTNLASTEDICAMKILAACQRGTKRDFVDLFFIAKKTPIDHMISLYHQKFKNTASEKTHILKSLIYFTDAEKEPMPKMIIPVNWQEIKKFFEKEVKKISRDLITLK